MQSECGAGNLCGGDNACRPIEQVLNSGDNRIYWVNQLRGNDTNPGTRELPWASIKRATQAGTLAPGDAVIIRSGVYYGAIEPKVGGQNGKRITFAAFPGDKVIVSGAEKIPGTWVRDGADWVLEWPYQPLWTRRVNDGHPQADDARRRDVLIASGKMLKPVYNRGDLKDNHFFLQGSPDNPQRMFVRLPAGNDPNALLMETSRVNNLFNPSSNDRNCMSGTVLGHFRLIGITFRHAANEAQQGAVCSGSVGSLIENVTVEWTNGAGILVSGKNHVVRGTTANSNGMSGIRGEMCDGCVVEYSTSRFNNWKGYDPFWESGGGKWQSTTNSVFRHLDFSDNEGPGLWIDIDNTNNVIEKNRFNNNLGVNLFIEYQSNHNLIRNNVSTNARFARPAFYGYGMLIHASDHNDVIHNTFMGNDGGGLRIRADQRGDAVHNRYYNNLFIANLQGEQGAVLSFEEHRNADLARTNRGDGNVFSRYATATQTLHSFQFRPSNANGSNVLRSGRLSDWQDFSGSDRASTIVGLEHASVRDTSDIVHGWRLVGDSHIRGKAVALPNDMAPVMDDIDGESRPLSLADAGADQFASDTPLPNERVRPGDASGNGVISALDAAMVLQHTIGVIDLSAQMSADASGDGKISPYDASLILQYITGYIRCIPADLECQPSAP